MTNYLTSLQSNLLDTHPIFAGALNRTIRKLFTSPEEFCAHAGIGLKQYEGLFKRDAEAWLPSLGVLTSMLFAIKVHSSIAFNALLHNLLEDIEDAWWTYEWEVKEEDEASAVVADSASSGRPDGDGDEAPAPWL